MLLTPSNPQDLIDKCIAIARKYDLKYGYNLQFNSNGKIYMVITTEKVIYGPMWYKGTKIYAA